MPYRPSLHLLWEVSIFRVLWIALLPVLHGLEILYVYGFLPLVNGSASALQLGGQIMDYWISFATSLDPNDGRGSQRKRNHLNI